eukprot:TRINITY_DN463_c4_g1_i1.p1 TRINITY_DN463_c4_g1~~TRINITY_DN463_c4_g1_i1.p1  ORF type:complete len:259 (-),score=112.42 TRINITY_DN463_c4_g1_i1:65-841(-)
MLGASYIGLSILLYNIKNTNEGRSKKAVLMAGVVQFGLAVFFLTMSLVSKFNNVMLVALIPNALLLGVYTYLYSLPIKKANFTTNAEKVLERTKQQLDASVKERNRFEREISSYKSKIGVMEKELETANRKANEASRAASGKTASPAASRSPPAQRDQTREINRLKTRVLELESALKKQNKSNSNSNSSRSNNNSRSTTPKASASIPSTNVKGTDFHKTTVNEAKAKKEAQAKKKAQEEELRAKRKQEMEEQQAVLNM